MNDTQFLTDLSMEEMVELVKLKGGMPFHGKSLFKWIFNRSVKDLDRMTDLPKSLRERLSEEYKVCRLQTAEEITSKDGTVKLLYRLNDGHCIETVSIPDNKRLTLCLSTQVGCAMGCRFCASGMKGFERNLTHGEIVEQVIHTKVSSGQEVTNIVFMGIGEPLLNMENLVKAITTINRAEGISLGARRITVSTMGIPDRIRKLAELGLQINLAISLHAADPEIRESLIPMSRKYPLDDILKAADYYRVKTTRDVTFEILLLKDVNDSMEDAQKLTALISNRKCFVNLIPFNRVKGLPFKFPETERVNAFRSIVEKAHIPVTVRRPRGMDIMAACGQLRLKDIEGAE